MYIQCHLASHTPTAVDQEVDSIMKKTGAKTRQEAMAMEEFEKVRTSKERVDCELVSSLRKQKIQNSSVKTIPESEEKTQFKPTMIIVSPLKASLQACMDLYPHVNVPIYVEPLIAPRVSAASSLSHNIHETLKQMQQTVDSSKVDENPDWYLSYGKTDQKSEQDPIDQCLLSLKKDPNFETYQRHYERLDQFKKTLLIPASRAERVAIITHPDVLEALTSTGVQQDGTLINKIPFDFGDEKNEFIWIQGYQGEFEQSTPFCSF